MVPIQLYVNARSHLTRFWNSKTLYLSENSLMLLMLSGGAEKLNRSLGKWRLIDIIDGSYAIYTGWLGKPTAKE